MSLFSGAGGLDLGFSQEGSELRFATDVDPWARETYARNLGHTPDASPVEDLDASDIPPADIIVAGPPCQGFSSIGKKNPRDPRNILLLKTAEIIARRQPRLYVIENVAGLQWLAKGRFLTRCQDILRSAAMRTAALVVDCSKNGVPQRRRRMLLIGGRAGAGDRFIALATARLNLDELLATTRSVLLPVPPFGSLPNHDVPTRRSDWYAQVVCRIGEGQKLCDTRLGSTSVHSWDIPRVFGPTTHYERRLLIAIARMRRSERGRNYGHVGDGKPVKLAHVAEALSTDRGTLLAACKRLAQLGYVSLEGNSVDLARKFNGRFKRLALDAPAPAVVREFASPRNVLHPTANRALTVRECARLQSFPDDFAFTGPKAAQYQQVANAFPPKVARALARLAKAALHPRRGLV